MRVALQFCLYLITPISPMVSGVSHTTQQQLPASFCPGEPIQIAWHRYYPYSYLDPKSQKLVGEDIRYISEIFDDLGCKIEFVRMTWGRTLLEIENGALDMTLYAYKTEDRAKRFLFSEPYRTQPIRLGILNKNKHKWQIKSLDDIRAFKLTVAADTHVWAGNVFEEFTKRYKGVHVFHVHSMNRRLEMLMSNRVDVIVGDPLAMEHEAKVSGVFDELFIVDFALYDSAVHLVLKKNRFSSTFVERLNKQLVQKSQY